MQWHRPTITGHRHGQCVHMGGISLISCIVNPLLKSIFMFSSWDLFDIDFELSRISCWEITTTCAFQRASILTCLINEHILGKCSRSRSSITNPRISPLSVKHKCPQLSLCTSITILRASQIKPLSYHIIPCWCIQGNGLLETHWIPRSKGPSLRTTHTSEAAKSKHMPKQSQMLTHRADWFASSGIKLRAV